jgi:hypothetical protein
MEALHILVLILHVGVAGLLLGTAFFGLLFARKQQLGAADVSAAKNVVLVGKPLSGIQLILGLILVFWEPSKFLNNPLIWSKLVLYVVSGFVAAAVIQKKLLASADGADKKASADLRKWLVILLVLVIALIALGVTAAETAA